MGSLNKQVDIPNSLPTRKSFYSPLQQPAPLQSHLSFDTKENKENEGNEKNASRPVSGFQKDKRPASGFQREKRPASGFQRSKTMKSYSKIFATEFLSANEPSSLSSDQVDPESVTIEQEDFLTKALANIPSNRVNSASKQQNHINQIGQGIQSNLGDQSNHKSHPSSAKANRRPSLGEVRKSAGSHFKSFKQPDFEIKMPLYRVSVEKRKRIILVEGVQHDMDRLTANILKTKGLHHHRDLVLFLGSELYDKFVKCAAAYARIYLREKLTLVHELGIKTSELDVPSSLIHFLTEFNKNEILSVEHEDLFQIHQTLTSSFFEFATTYFEILVFQRKSCKTQTRERILFEKIYTITVEIICQILSAYNLTYMLVNELNRCFRTDFFKPSIDDLLKDPQNAISFRFMNSLKSPFSQSPLEISSSLSWKHESEKRSASISLTASSPSSSSNTQSPNQVWTLRKLMVVTAPQSSSSHDKLSSATLQRKLSKSAKARTNISLTMIRSLRSPLGETYLPLHI